MLHVRTHYGKPFFQRQLVNNKVSYVFTHLYWHCHIWTMWKQCDLWPHSIEEVLKEANTSVEGQTLKPSKEGTFFCSDF